MSEQAASNNSITNTKIGHVISDKMDKTITVKIDRQVRHPKYKKYIKLNSKLAVHDENNECKVGDVVRIQQSRPLSKRKAWKMIEILESQK